ncbi:hypothetical protein HHL21_06320 [Massilia sp. RP-1-19]|uniref:Collagen-like protein n=1 Tax=Massilia polaris TaxID=2728846 RepID=A0A848HFR2_9BURK|nr:hypothetical protein [Massilia polaris]NML60706.1 hypothetical protein [Massilia polaris]
MNMSAKFANITQPRHAAAMVLMATAIAVVATVFPLGASAADVSFRAAFDAAAVQDVVSISVPENDTLVFESGAYYSKGRRILISAKNARVDGDVRIGFYAPDDRPSPKQGVAATGATGGIRSCSRDRDGCDGDTGKAGDQGAKGDGGANASSLVFEIGELTGAGRVTLLAAGQSGGQGQKGGKGGRGGNGEKGAKRSCNAYGGTKAGPGNGGRGGNGGVSGAGGTGGSGGDGATITLSSNLLKSLEANTLAVDLNPASGGPGGERGDAGDPGAGGASGPGNNCGGGGSGGNYGDKGSVGTPGAEGKSGASGTLRYWNDAEEFVGAEPYKARLVFELEPVANRCDGRTWSEQVVTLQAGLMCSNRDLI